MLQSGDSLSSGEVAGGIYAADDGALLFTSEKPDFNVFVPTNSQGTEGHLTLLGKPPAGLANYISNGTICLVNGTLLVEKCLT